MKICKKNLYNDQQKGSMLIELMMSIALAAIVIPFIFKYQQNTIAREKNIAVTRQMENVEHALERYIIANKTELMLPVGKNITRVKISDLSEYGLSEDVIDDYGDQYQLRILKTANVDNKSVLQGVVILTNNEISPLRTREIVNIGGGKIGFVEGSSTHGAFGAFHTNSVDYDINTSNGIIKTTDVTRGDVQYLWRLPSGNVLDSTMLSSLNLSGHDIVNTMFLNSVSGVFDEKLKIGKSTVDTLTFQTRTDIDSSYSTNSAVVSGILTSDSRDLNILGSLSLSDSAKVSSFETNDLYTNTLTLSGLSIVSSDKPAVLQINENLDVVTGTIAALYVTVGYTGSVTPRLVVNKRIQDSIDSSYYWDVENQEARFADASFAELSRMAVLVSAKESVSGTASSSLFGSVSSNTNATVADYLNALKSIKTSVENKYHLLNLK
ncbi:MAG: hypothetical protein MJ156_01025 [Alphaproteobacteria bacterium]|nr:hypothetical protein [Alphaproteobacteria bacterium]